MSGANATGRADYRRWAVPALVIAIAVLLRCLSFLHDDISWLITMGEKFLAGETPYIDLIDVNPPASFLIYLPQVLLARMLALSPTAIVNASVLLAGLCSVLASERILAQHRLIAPEPMLAALALFILLVLCGDTFAQREHVALIALLPLLAAYVVRAEGQTPALGWAIVAGIGGGVALAIKPYFLLPILLPLLFVAWTQKRKLRDIVLLALAPEHSALALTAILYAVAVVTFFPAYLERILPMALDLYQPLRLTLLELAREASTWAIIIAAIITFVFVRRDINRPLLAILLLSGLGFAAGYFIQSKGWAYHAYPAVALWLLAASIAWAGNHKAISAKTLLAIAALVAADLLWVRLPFAYPRFFHSVAALAPPNPKITAIAETLVVPQMARLIGGTWVGPVPNQFMSKNAGLLLNANPPPDAAAAKRLQGYVDYDRAILVKNIRMHAPDVVVITEPWLKDWALANPDIAEALRPYQEAAIIEGVAIWLRTEPNSATFRQY